MTRFALARTLVAALAALALSPVSARAAEPATAQIEQLEIGFNGRYKLGYWTSLRVIYAGLTASGPAWAEATVLDGDGVPAVYRSAEQDLSRHASFEILIKPGRPNGPITIEVHDAVRPLARRTFAPPEFPPALPSSRFLYLTLLANDEALGKALPQVPHDEALKADIVSMGLNKWPSAAAAYDAVDGILLNDIDPVFPVTNLLLPGAPVEQWLARGGKVVVCARAQAARTFAAGTLLSRLGKLAEPVPLHRPAALARFAAVPGREESSNTFAQQTLELAVPRWTGGGQIAAFEGLRPTDLPLVVQNAYGLGELTYVPLDWGSPPLAGWADRGYFFNRLFRREVNRSERKADLAAASFAQTGYDDLAGQLRRALDEFPGVTPIPFWSIALLVGLFIAVIGPLDYWLVHRVLRRMRAAWITLPISLVVFSGLAVWLAKADKGTQVHVRQADLIDVDLADGALASGEGESSVSRSNQRGTSWFQVFSPHQTELNLSLHTAPPTAATQLAWLGLPGTSLGGMDIAETSLFSAEVPAAYAFDAPRRSLRQFPIGVSSSRALTAEYEAPLVALPKIDLRRVAEGQLAGSITLRDLTLDDAILFYEKSLYLLHRLQAGETWSVDLEREPASNESYLNRRHLQGEKIVATPYDPFDTDLRRILDMILFYDAAGGRGYTHLFNRYFNKLDLSGQLHLGRAILIGRADLHPVQLHNGDQPLARPDDQPITFVRFIINVPAGARSAAP
ncbi:MAG TPA: hypothetical protein VFE24_11520 [Pirellulales bacterium]|jgi:hypothetical protein|nr:hypothetical protein [Pirellulales bacterium]